MPRGFYEVPSGYLLASRKPDFRLALDVFDELAKRCDAVRLADDMRMQADVHDTPRRSAFSVELIETQFEHIDAIAGGEATARKHVEVIDVVRVRHADDWAVTGADQIRLIIVEVVAIGDQAEFLEEYRRVQRASDRR